LHGWRQYADWFSLASGEFGVNEIISGGFVSSGLLHGQLMLRGKE
jgi:hypothetical protein